MKSPISELHPSAFQPLCIYEALPGALFVFKILPEEDDYGFDIEEKNKAIVVKSVRRGSSAEVRPDICKYFVNNVSMF